VLSLKDYYDELDAAELRERQELAFEAALRMRDRLLLQEVWEDRGVDPKEATLTMRNGRCRRRAELPPFDQVLHSGTGR